MGSSEERDRMDKFGLLQEIITELRNVIEPAGIGKNPDVCRLFFVQKSENAVNSYLDLQKK